MVAAPAAPDQPPAIEPAELLRAIVDGAPFATIAFDAEQRIVLWSAGAERILGWSASEVLGRRLPDGFVPARDRTSSQSRIRRTLDGASVQGDLVRRRTKDGRDVLLEIHGGPVYDTGGNAIGYAGHMVDVTRLREMERDLETVARVGATLAATIARLDAAGSLLDAAQAICDELRHLPEVDFVAVGAFSGEDTLILAANAEAGIPIVAGERLERHRSRSLQHRARSGPWAQSWDAQEEDGEWGRRMTASGLRAFAFGPIVHGSHVDGGVVIGTRDTRFARQLEAKWAGLVDFSTTPSALLAERLHTLGCEVATRAEIASVIDRAAFRPVFQPIVDLATSEVVGHEALSRFESGRSPEVVFFDAHAVGLGLELELATLRAAVDAAVALPPGRWLSLNVSPSLLDDATPLRMILRTADRPVILEITEHAIVADYDAFRIAVRSLGRDIRLAVDDAGAGVANFGHIVDLGPDFVKLDQSLIRRVNGHLGRQALIVGMRYFSRTSGCRLVAEGIETDAEARALAELGVEFGQGFLFGAPAPVDVLVE